MKIEPISSVYFKNAKKVVVSKLYIIILTGKAIIVLDKERNYVKTIDGLKYAYEGLLSPDGGNLLIISNKPEFYIFSLDTLEITGRYKLKGNISTIEGSGCWSPDGKSIFLILMEKRTGESFLRVYQTENPNNFVDNHSIGYMLNFHNILSLPSENAIYIIAQNRYNQWADSDSDSIVLLRLTGDQINRYEISDQSGIPFSMEYNETTRRLVIYTLKQAFTCDLDGKNMRMIDTGNNSHLLEPNLLFTPFIVKQILESSNQKYIFMVSNGGLDIFDRQTGASLYFKEFSYGLENITEIEENIIAVGLYSGSGRLYKLSD